MKDKFEQTQETRPELQKDERLDMTDGTPLRRYKWRAGGTLDEHDTGDIYEDTSGQWVKWEDMLETQDNLRHLRDLVGTMSKQHAKDMARLSDMIDRRDKAMGYISEIMQEKYDEREDLELGSTSYKSVRRWAAHFSQNTSTD